MNVLTLNGLLRLRLAWTGPPAPVCFAHIGWDTCPALLAPLAYLASLALKVLLNTTQKVKCLKEVLEKSVCDTQSTLVGHLKSILLKAT